LLLLLLLLLRGQTAVAAVRAGEEAVSGHGGGGEGDRERKVSCRLWELWPYGVGAWWCSCEECGLPKREKRREREIQRQIVLCAPSRAFLW
jgi:hypothetical protein